MTDDAARWKQLEDSIDALSGKASPGEIANRYKHPHNNVPYDEPRFAITARHKVQTELGELLERWPLGPSLEEAIDRVAVRLREFQEHTSWQARLLDGVEDPRTRLVRRFDLDHDEYDAERIAQLVSRASAQICDLYVGECDFPDGMHTLFEGVEYPALWRLALDAQESVDEEDWSRTIAAIATSTWLAGVEELSLVNIADAQLATLIANPAFRAKQLEINGSFGERAAAALAARPWSVEKFSFRGGLSRAAIEALCEQTSLRRVEIRGCVVAEMPDADLERLGERLALRELVLSTPLLCGENGGNVKLASIARLRLLSSVERLEISMGDQYDDIESLARSPFLTKLTHLQIAGRYLTDRGRDSLRAALPNCSVEVRQ